jgi:hypothetical protein
MGIIIIVDKVLNLHLWEIEYLGTNAEQVYNKIKIK